MRHLSLEAGRRRRGRLLAAWIVSVILGFVALLKLGPALPAAFWQVMLLGVVAAIAYPSWWTKRRNAEVEAWYLRGRCLTCGYDLRANEDRCPECGRPAGPLRL